MSHIGDSCSLRAGNGINLDPCYKHYSSVVV